MPVTNVDHLDDELNNDSNNEKKNKLDTRKTLFGFLKCKRFFKRDFYPNIVKKNVRRG